MLQQAIEAYGENVRMLDDWNKMIEDAETEHLSRLRDRDDFLSLTGGKESKGEALSEMENTYENTIGSLVEQLERQYDQDVEVARDRHNWAIAGRNETQRQIEQLVGVINGLTK